MEARMWITPKELIAGLPLTRNKLGLTPIPRIAVSDHISFHIITIFFSEVYPLSFRLNAAFFAASIFLLVVREVIYVYRNPAF